MFVRLGFVLLLASCWAACGAGKTDSAKAEPVPDLKPVLPPQRPEPRAAVAEQPAVAAQWRITSTGVGALTLRAAVPQPAAGFAASYTTTFYADAQPLEGFQFSDPPALAVVAKGPFEAWGNAHPGKEAPAAIRKRAASLATAGKLPVEMIVITDPRARTEEGVGAGDSYASAVRANPKLTELERFPGLWEEPSCVATQGSIWYFFDRCDAPAEAKLLRIVVRNEDER
jgi:hypothetical protein